MIKKLLVASTLAATAVTGVATAPASAHDYYGRERYYQYRDDYYARDDHRDWSDRGYGYRPRYYDHHYRRCSSGTTGAVVGAVLGGLLGREIGRGGYYNRPSTTGLILGAGGGALAGRAIEREGSHC